MPSFRTHSSTLISQNSIFKEILGRVLTHSGFYRKESSFLPFFKLTFTDKIRPEKDQLAVGPGNVTIIEVYSTCTAQGQLQLGREKGGGGGGEQMHAECCSSDLGDVYALYPLLCCSFNYQKGNFKIAWNMSFPIRVKRITSTLKKVTKLFTAVSPAPKTGPGPQQMYNVFLTQELFNFFCYLYHISV